MSVLIPTDRSQSTPIPMQEVAQDDHERVEQLYGRLMKLDIPAFVIRASLNPEQLAGATQAIESENWHDRLYGLSNSLAHLHTQARTQIEAHTGNAYEPPLDYEEGPALDVQINSIAKGKGLGGHIDADYLRPSKESPTVGLHTVLQGDVNVEMSGYNYPSNGEGQAKIDPENHTASLSPGDTVVSRVDGEKPTFHDYKTTSENTRVSAIQAIRPDRGSVRKPSVAA